MPRISGPLSKTDQKKFLVKRKFPLATIFNEDSLGAGPGSHQTDEAAAAYYDEVCRLPAEELNKLVRDALSAQALSRSKLQEIEEQKLSFNRPDARANFGHWAMASYWSIEEATALSLGRDPRRVQLKSIKPFVHISSFAKLFTDRLDLLCRAQTMGQLYPKSSPSFFLAWAQRIGLSVPSELVESVTSLGVQIADWKTLYERQRENFEIVKEALDTERAERRSEASRPTTPAQKELPLRERESLLKLVIGMAVKGYSYDPASSRSPTAKEIATDLALIGLPMDEDTVRKYLKESAGLLPQDPAE